MEIRSELCVHGDEGSKGKWCLRWPYESFLNTFNNGKYIYLGYVSRQHFSLFCSACSTLVQAV